MKTILITIAVVVGIILMFVFVIPSPPIPTPTPQTTTSPIPTASPTALPTLSPTPVPRVPSISLSGPSQVNVGDIITIQVIADSNGQLIDGIDVMLTVSPNLRVIGYTPTQAIPIHNYNTALPAANKFNFSQITNGGQQLVVNGVIAQIRLETLVSGLGTITIDFTPGSTRDSNIAKDGTDILERVSNVSVQIQ